MAAAPPCQHVSQVSHTLQAELLTSAPQGPCRDAEMLMASRA
jgi:hypothetical protein